MSDDLRYEAALMVVKQSTGTIALALTLLSRIADALETLAERNEDEPSAD